MFKNKKGRKKISAKFSGDKKDIKVVQNNEVEASEGFLQLPGLDNYGDLAYSDKNEPLYAEVEEAEVTETVPKYNIPLPQTNVNCPDVKISVI